MNSAAASPTAVPLYDSATRGNRAWAELREIWRYRPLLRQLIRRDIVTRYKRSFLGLAWTMLSPLGTMVVLYLVFSKLFPGIERYPVYVLSGVLFWTFFAQSTSQAMQNLLWGGTLLTRIYMPATSFPISAIGSNMVNWVLSLVPLFAVMLITGMPITLAALFVPVSMLIVACFALGVALIVSAYAIFFYDIAEMYGIILTAWMYLTPILYPESLLRDHGRGWLLDYNPLYYLISTFRAPLYDGRLPTLLELGISVAVALAALVIGWLVYTRRAEVFAYRV